MTGFIARFQTSEAKAPAIADALGDDEALGSDAVAASEVAPGKWEVHIYFSGRPDAVALRKSIARALAQPLARTPKVTVAPLPDEDWVAVSLAGLAPVAAGRFLVHGGHDRARRLPNLIAIEIEAGQAFGTGHHGTTRGCLLMLERLARRACIENPLDLGTGSGVLAIAMARLWRVPVLAADIDPVATRVAVANAGLNGVGALVEAVTAAGLAGPAIRRRAPYDLVVANILAGPLVDLAPAFARHALSGGRVILSGILEAQAPRVLAAFRTHGFVRRDQYLEEGWTTLLLEYRPARMKKRSPMAPLRRSD